MDLLLPILLGFLASLIGGLYLLGVFRRRKPGEPPLDKGLIPWIGHAFAIHRDSVQFLNRMRQKHGDVFTVLLGGTYVTFLQDPLSFGTFIKESTKKLDFASFIQNVFRRGFHYEGVEEDQHDMIHFSNKHLKGDGLKLLTQAMMARLQEIMLHVCSAEDQGSWKESGLFLYSCSIIFRAGYLSLFGSTPPKPGESLEEAQQKDRDESETLYYDFNKFDKFFPRAAFGILSSSEKLEVLQLLKVFWGSMSVQKMTSKENVSGWLWDIKQSKEEAGVEELMITRYMFLLFWGSQTNTGPASFWLLYFLMKHPDAMRAVKKEVDKVLKESGQEVKRGGPLINVTYDMLRQTPILDSAIEETLRLRGTGFFTRDVLQDMTFTMASGKEYFLRKGDRMSIFPYYAIQLDPEIHPDPQSFKYDRFLNPDGSKKTDFYKNGKKVKYYSMPWGGGASMCPGRFFATNEMKQFVVLLLAYFEIELKNPEEISEVNIKHLGFGVVEPLRDVHFRYRFRSPS